MNDTINGSNDTSNDNPTITRTLIAEAERMAFVDKLFGLSFPMRLEPTVFQFAEHLAFDYHGGYWQFYELSNGGFYMAPRTETVYAVSSMNGFEGEMTADALGVTACLYAYSHLSFGDGVTSTGENAFAESCAQHYHLLREYMFGHGEVRSILRAID